MTDEQRITHFDAVLSEAIGGAEVVEMLTQHHTDGMSVREIASIHHEPESTVRTRLNRARATLRRLQLMPEAWEAQHASAK